MLSTVFISLPIICWSYSRDLLVNVTPLFLITTPAFHNLVIHAAFKINSDYYCMID